MIPDVAPATCGPHFGHTAATRNQSDARMGTWMRRQQFFWPHWPLSGASWSLAAPLTVWSSAAAHNASTALRPHAGHTAATLHASPRAATLDLSRSMRSPRLQDLGRLEAALLPVCVCTGKPSPRTRPLNSVGNRPFRRGTVRHQLSAAAEARAEQPEED